MIPGDKVVIKECHAIPTLAGEEARVVAMVDRELTKYPIRVLLTGGPVEVETPLGVGLSKGPFPFREDELEPFHPDHGIPEIFTKE